MRIVGVALLIGLLHQSAVFAQEVFVVGKGGLSSYGSAYFGNLAGSGGDQNWKSGPIVALGARMRTSEAFAFEGLVEYSTHRYAPREWENPPSNNPKNSILEVTTTGRLSIGIFGGTYLDIIGGVGLSSQHKDERTTVQGNSVYTTPGRQAVDFGAILGTGLEVRVSRSIELSLEGSWRMRFYVTPVVQLGVAYAL